MKVDDLLRNENNNDIHENIDSIIPEEKIEILCNGKYLRPTFQLKDVKELFWQAPFENPNHHADLLILNYRRKFTKSESSDIASDKQYISRRAYKMKYGADGLSQILQNPQIPVPQHLSFLCSSCSRTLTQPSIMIKNSSARVNCQRCGDCFCSECCKTPIL